MLMELILAKLKFLARSNSGFIFLAAISSLMDEASQMLSVEGVLG